jgi:NitT/TauT family transport system substrate-binding protein
MPITQSRRHFLTSLSAAGAAALLGARPALAAEGPPETTTVRLPRFVRVSIGLGLSPD